MRKKILNTLVLIGAATAGAIGMWFWDDSVQKFQVHLVEQQLLKGVQHPLVDIHKIGLHGEFADSHAHHHEDGDGHEDHEDGLTPDQEKRMADADAKARQLFATPGGAYTKADIERNGSTPPSERFDKVEFLYSMKAHEGDPIDPILGTKTAGAFNWSIGGKTYHFASIASLEEFVMRAKKDPSSILPPSHYVQARDSHLASR
jgi:YHS domain-containing protein